MIGLVGTYPYHILALLFFSYILFKQWKKSTSRNPNGLPLPPGPKGYPLLGNLFDMPIDKPWLVYDEWRKTYGDIIYFNVLGQHFMVLSDLKSTTDLFEKRSSNYSDRMRLPMLNELMSWDMSLALMPYGLWWRKHRRLFVTKLRITHHHYILFYY